MPSEYATELTADLFEAVPDARPSREAMADGAVLLRGFARSFEAELLPALRAIVAAGAVPASGHAGRPPHVGRDDQLRQCRLGDRTTRGYRYDAIDPESGQPWPAMPPVLRRLAADAASGAGFNGFAPEACLINRYVPGAKLSLHQDKDELDFAAPIVSVSLGLPAIFLFGGLKRADKPRSLPAGARRRRGLGRAVAAFLPRCRAARRRRARRDGPPAHQSDISQGAVTCPGRGAAFFTLLRRAGTHGATIGPGLPAHRSALHPGHEMAHVFSLKLPMVYVAAGGLT